MRMFIFSILVLFSCVGFAAPLQYASIVDLVEQDIGRIVITEVYKQIGLEIAITPMPGKQAQKNATSGAYDGEIMRIWSYGEESSSVIRVPTPYYYLETMAFFKPDVGVKVNKKEDLANYRILKILGVKHTENIVVGLDNVVDVNSTAKMMQLLDYGRADVALTNTVDGMIALRKLKMQHIVHSPKPLAVLDLYHYIHQRHASLVPKVNDVIVAMKASGELQQIIKRAEQQVIHSVRD